MFGHCQSLIVASVISLVRLSDPEALSVIRGNESSLKSVIDNGQADISMLKVDDSQQDSKGSQKRKVNNERLNEGSHLQNFSYYMFQDAFECSPCICFRDENQILTAFCSKRNLENVPNNFPVTIRSLNMTDNSMWEFNTASVGTYVQMTSLVVRYNRLLNKVALHSQVNTSTKLKDLGHNNISSIQNGSFCYYGHLRELMLDFNKLINITTEMFEGLNNLHILNLSDNKIRYLRVDTFSTLESLEFLDLSRNALNYNAKSIPPMVFKELCNLRHLYLQGNVLSSHPYPDEALSKLSHLAHLYLDVSVASRLGPLFSSLKNLTSLTLGGKPGYCYLRDITRDFLENVPYLKTFSIVGCHLYHIDTSVYRNVELIEKLEIRETSESFDLDIALGHLQGLVNSSLKTLRLISLSRTTDYLCTALGKDHAKYLQHIKLEELDLSQNHISLIDKDFARLLPKTLKRLVLKDNKLTIKVFSLICFYSLSELTEIHLDHQNDELMSYDSVEDWSPNGLHDEIPEDHASLSDTDANFYGKYNVNVNINFETVPFSSKHKSNPVYTVFENSP